MGATSASLPEAPEDVPAGWRLHVDGLVLRPLCLTLAELEMLGRAAYRGQVSCRAGGSADAPAWTGVPLAAVLARAAPLPEATSVRVLAPGYQALLPLDTAEVALLAIGVDGAPLPLARGGPCRLVVPGGAHHLSVKGVERLELCRRHRDG